MNEISDDFMIWLDSFPEMTEEDMQAMKQVAIEDGDDEIDLDFFMEIK